MTELENQIKNEAEKVFKHLAIDYLTKNVPEFDVSQTYGIDNCDADPLSLVSEVGNVQRYPSYLQPIFSFDTGDILTFEERWIDDENDEGSSKTSMSIRRAPDVKSFSQLLGNSSNVPFLPGGFNEEVEKIFRFSNKEEVKHEEEEQFFDFTELLNTPPGFSGCVNVSGNVSKNVEDQPYDFEASQAEIAQSQRLYMPNIDLDSADIFDILNMVTDQPIRGVNKKLESGGGIIRSQCTDLVGDETTEKSFLSADETGKLEETIAAELSISKDPSPQEALAKKRKLKAKDQDYMFAQMLNVNEKVIKYQELLPVMAKKYPFALDPFQQHAVVSMEEGISVFVAAHTSAGKTVVAEYAIALCKIHMTRVIYTSPIKALSNQKFRDFKMIFEDVGLVTGDIQLHTDAFCLIMTTEILRSMLYNGSEVIRELEWVIFDEVHYINDSERGHVWEEVFILLPAHVKIVMLSATVPNCMEFADWLGRIKSRKINVMQTLKRPVPLEHYLYTGQDGKTRKDIFKIMDKDGEFLNWGYKKAIEAKKNAIKGNSKNKPNPHTHNEKNIYINLIEHLKGEDLLPMVVFIFSRKRCDQTAELLQSIDLTTAKEKSEIHKFFNKCIDRLKGSDRKLPQVLLMQEHCKRGFAVHHSGILPIIKEVVELLFQQGYVKILFATETFAMGVNMPARTVVFDTIEKFDGNSRRFLNATEYVQMAGRAGRRGLDSTGTVIVLCKGTDPPDVLCLTNMLKGKAVCLESKFRITYKLILNLMRVKQVRIEDMLQRSFVERTSLRLMVSRKEHIEEYKNELLETPEIDCSTCMPKGCSSSSSIMTYYQTVRHYIHEMPSVWADLVANYDMMKVFATGRVLLINHPPLELVGVLAVLLQAKKNGTGKFLLTVMICVDEQFLNEVPEKLSFHEKLSKKESRWRRETLLMEHIARCGIEGVAQISSSHTYYILQDLEMDCIMAVLKQQVKAVDLNIILQDFEGRKRIFRNYSPDRMVKRVITELNSLAERLSSPAIDMPVQVLGEDIIKNGVEIFKRLKVVKELRLQLTDPNTFNCRFCVYFVEHLKQLMKRIRLEEGLAELDYQTSSNGLLMFDDYMGRLKVLQALDYVDKSNMVGLKGKVACEINNQELLITELMLENKFENRSCAEIAAMLSPLTCQSATAKASQKANCEGEVSRAPAHVLEQLKKDLVDVANRIDRVQQSCRVHTLVLDELMFDLMETIYQWANGMPFSEIMKLTDTQEGIIVRCIQRLDEVLKDVRNAARIVGNPALYEKMEETSATIKRDIVFAASLYTTE